jgi:hypothetical protein
MTLFPIFPTIKPTFLSKCSKYLFFPVHNSNSKQKKSTCRGEIVEMLTQNLVEVIDNVWWVESGLFQIYQNNIDL